MTFRIALPIAMAALFVCGTAPIASAKKYHKHMVAKGPGIQVQTGTKKQSATGGPSGGSTKNASGGGAGN